MNGRLIPLLPLSLPVVALAATILLVAPEARAAGPDRKAPTTPTNLSVTAVTAYTVTLTWGASMDNSGGFHYRVIWSGGDSAIVPQTQTTFTWVKSLQPQQTYSFFVHAVDAAGNWSKASNTVSATLSRDTTAPSAPQISLTEAGPTHLTLAWTSQDDDPTLTYTVTRNGSVYQSGYNQASISFPFLQWETAYTFTVQSRDSSGHWSPVSAPFSATTDPRPDDDTPPTTPPALWGGAISDCEVMFSWGVSSDDLTPPQLIRYFISLNGVFLDATTFGYTTVIEYGNVDGPNRFEVIAVDEADNKSAPAAVTFDLFGCFPSGS